VHRAENPLLTPSDLRGYFQEALASAARNQHLGAEAHTLDYLADLLTDYSRADRLFDHGEAGITIPPLATLYLHAAEAPTRHERHALLRRLGDLALFLSSLFSGFLQRRLVDVDYCVTMGSGAYGVLCSSAADTLREPPMSRTFAQLAEQFRDFVEVLAEVGEGAWGGQSRDVLDLYEEWRRTGSPQLARRLRRAGITPVAHAH
jgi:hypothetical protein